MLRPRSSSQKFSKTIHGDGEQHYYFITPQIRPHEIQLRILQDLHTPSNTSKITSTYTHKNSCSYNISQTRGFLHYVSWLLLFMCVLLFRWRARYNQNLLFLISSKLLGYIKIIRSCISVCKQVVAFDLPVTLNNHNNTLKCPLIKSIIQKFETCIRLRNVWGKCIQL